MKKYCLIVLLLGVLPLSGKISLPDAIKKGLNQDYNLKNQELAIKAIRSQQEIAAKRKRFSVNFNSSYLFKSMKMELELPDMTPLPGITIPGTNREVGALHNFDLNLGVAQPLYSGGILSSGVEKEEIREAVEESRLRLKQAETAGAIKTAYFNHHLLVQKRKSLEKLQRNLELHWTKLRDYFQEELIRKSDVLETRTKIEEVAMQLSDLDRAIAEQRILFHHLCNIEATEIDDTYREPEQNFEQASAFFSQHHPMLKALTHQLKLTEVQCKVISGKYRPQINGFAEVHYGKPGLDFFKNRWGLYFQGGISLSLPIFNWNLKREELAMADISARQIENRRQDFIKENQKRLKQLFSTLQALRTKLDHLERAIALAREDASLKEQLYRENQIDNIDYLSAVITAERYLSMKYELQFQLELVKVSINTVTGYMAERPENNNERRSI